MLPVVIYFYYIAVWLHSLHSYKDRTKFYHNLTLLLGGHGCKSSHGVKFLKRMITLIGFEMKRTRVST